MSDLALTMLGGGTRVVSHLNLSDLALKVTGPLLRPGDDGYDAARSIWNAIIGGRPALIARCKDVDDVVAATRFARGRSPGVGQGWRAHAGGERSRTRRGSLRAA